MQPSSSKTTPEKTEQHLNDRTSNATYLDTMNLMTSPLCDYLSKEAFRVMGGGLPGLMIGGIPQKFSFAIGFAANLERGQSADEALQHISTDMLVVCSATKLLGSIPLFIAEAFSIASPGAKNIYNQHYNESERLKAEKRMDEYAIYLDIYGDIMAHAGLIAAVGETYQAIKDGVHEIIWTKIPELSTKAFQAVFGGNANVQEPPLENPLEQALEISQNLAAILLFPPLDAREPNEPSLSPIPIENIAPFSSRSYFPPENTVQTIDLALLPAELQFTLNDLKNMSSESIEALNTEYASSEQHPLCSSSRPKKVAPSPLITRIEFGFLNDNTPGIIAKLEHGAIGVGLGAGGVLIYGQVEFGSAFWATLGPALGMAAIAAAIVLPICCAYTHHIKSIHKKIEHRLRDTQRESQQLQYALSKFSSHYEKEDPNLATLIKENQKLLKNAQKNYEKERKREASDRKEQHTTRFDSLYSKDRSKIAKAGKKEHYAAAKNYQQLIDSLKNNALSLEQKMAQETFIKTHQQASTSEIKNAMQAFSQKTTLSLIDIGEIEGVRSIAFMKAFELAYQGKLKEANDFLKEMEVFSYFLPGNVPLFNPTLSAGTGDETKQDVKDINQHITKINETISSGGNAFEAITALCDFIDKNNRYYKKYGSIIKRWEKRDHAKDAAPELQGLRNSLDPLKEQYKNGNNPANLQLTEIQTLMEPYLTEVPNSSDFWLSEYRSFLNGEKNLSETQIPYFKIIVFSHLEKAVQQTADTEGIEAAYPLINTLRQSISDPESNILWEAYLEGFTNAQAILQTKDLQVFFDRMKALSGVGTESEMKALLIEKTVLHNDFDKMISQKTFSGDLVGVTADCVAYGDAVPEVKKLMALYTHTLQTIEPFKTASNEALVAQVAAVSEVSNHGSEETIDSNLALSGLRGFFLRNISALIKDRDYSKAIVDLEMAFQKDPNPAAKNLYAQFITSVGKGIIHADQNVPFWLKQYTNCLATQEKNATSTEVQLDVMIAQQALFAHVEKQSQLGYYGKSSKILKSIYTANPSLTHLKPLIEDHAFLHQGQLISTVIRPLSQLLISLLDDANGRFGSAYAVKALQVIQQFQAVIPNLPTMLTQLAISPATHGLSVFLRNNRKFFSEFFLDVRNPFRNGANGALIISQAVFLAARLLPMHLILGAQSLQRLGSGLYYGERYLIPAAFLASSVKALSSSFIRGVGMRPQATSLIATAGSLTIDLCLNVYEDFWRRRGYAIESKRYYRISGTISTVATAAGCTALGTLLMAGSGGWLAGAVIATVFGIHYTYEWLTGKADKRSAEQVLGSALSNLGKLQDFQYWLEYIEKATYTLQKIIPSQEDFARRKSERPILFVKRDASYFAYYVGTHPEFFSQKRLKGNTEFLDHLLSGGSNIFLLSGTTIAPSQKIAFDSIVESPLKANYPAKSSYYTFNGFITGQDILKKVKEEEMVCFSKEIENNDPHFYLYFQDQKIELEAEITNGFFTEIEKDHQSFKIEEKDPRHETVKRLATKAVTLYRLHQEFSLLKNTLDETFNGILFDRKNPSSVANAARVVYFSHQLQELFEQENKTKSPDFRDFLKSSEKIERTDLINSDYQVPSHLVWRILVYYRLRIFAETESLLLSFPKEFQIYTNAIYASGKTDEVWHHSEWKIAKEAIENVLAFALKNFIISAQNAKEDSNQQKALLSQVTREYGYSKEWHELINDNEKFQAAFLCHLLSLHDKCLLFIRKIKNIDTFIHKNASRSTFLTMMEHSEIASVEDVLMNATTKARALEKLNKIFSLLKEKRIEEAKKFYVSGDFSFGKKTVEAAIVFYAEGEGSLLKTISILSEETQKTFEYWLLLYRLFLKLIASIEHSPSKNQKQYTQKMFGLLIAAAEKLQSFPEMTFPLKNETLSSLSLAKERLTESYGNIPSESITVKIDALLQEVHKLLRGETPDVTLVSVIKKIMTTAGYHLANNISEKYFPISVPADNNCAFHTLNISRKESITLLLKKVKEQTWIAKTQPLSKQDFVNRLLDDIASETGEIFDRAQSSFSQNQRRVCEYLRTFRDSNNWVPCSEAGDSLLSVLALLYNKNLRVFTHQANELSLFCEHRFDDSFETVDVLFTAASGYSDVPSEKNHYVLLEKFSDLTSVASRARTDSKTRPSYFFPKFSNQRRASQRSDNVSVSTTTQQEQRTFSCAIL